MSLPRVSQLAAAVCAAVWSLSAVAAGTASLHAQAEAALAQGDCTAMIEAHRQLAASGEQEPGENRAALQERLADAILALPDCGDTQFQLLRSRPARGNHLLRPDAQEPQR